MTSGLGEFGVDVPEPETQPDEPDHDTSEDYKFSRPQCRALTADGDRCSNPVRRTEDTAEFCPRHHDTDCETIDDALETDGGVSMGRQWTPSRRERGEQVCQNCGAPVTLQFRRVFGDNDDVAHACPECEDTTALSDTVGFPGGDA